MTSLTDALDKPLMLNIAALLDLNIVASVTGSAARCLLCKLPAKGLVVT